MFKEKEIENIDISSFEMEVEPVERGKTENLSDKVISEGIPKTLGKIPKELQSRK